ncbi:hypothetical protein [Streptomyces sp. DG1A-41]|uniref:hypothetical protein n=1 Tax=Streptomyces sp. DG1A-41 TaxID=3125779 RepID=UPI0030D5487D
MPRWRKLLFLPLGAVALAAVVVLVHVLVTKPDTCADGVERIDGECIGVNGEGYDFGTPEITDVARAIARENRSIENQNQPYVTVAMMLSLQSDREALRRQMRSRNRSPPARTWAAGGPSSSPATASRAPAA